jgi:ribonuclease BN (tRNA processing enzyme)
MELVVLGAGPAYTDRPGAAGAAYLIRDGGKALVLDLGQGVFPRLAGELDPADLLAVVVSHLHPDHFVDLIPLRHYLAYEFRPGRRISVHAPAGLETRLDGLMGEPGFARASLDIVPLGLRPRAIRPFALQAALVAHTDESYAFRLATGDGPGLVYSGDCGRADDLRALLQPGDTLLAEVSFGPGPVPAGALHLDAPAVAGVASRSRVGRVLVTHLQMGFDAAETERAVRSGFDGDVRLVWPGDRLTV